MTKKWIKYLSEEALARTLQELCIDETNGVSMTVRTSKGTVYYDTVSELITDVLSVRQDRKALLVLKNFAFNAKQVDKINRLLVQ